VPRASALLTVLLLAASARAQSEDFKDLETRRSETDRISLEVITGLVYEDPDRSLISRKRGPPLILGVNVGYWGGRFVLLEARGSYLAHADKLELEGGATLHFNYAWFGPRVGVLFGSTARLRRACGQCWASPQASTFSCGTTTSSERA
jgi:hypothetical protein